MGVIHSLGRVGAEFRAQQDNVTGGSRITRPAYVTGVQALARSLSKTWVVNVWMVLRFGCRVRSILN